MIFIYCDKCKEDITDEFGFLEEVQITIFDLKHTEIYCSDCIRKIMLKSVEKKQSNSH